MKKFLFLFLLAAAISNVHATGIEPKSPVGMSLVKAGNTYKLFYRGEKPGTVKVTIYNSKGVALLKDQMHHIESFMRPYNFSSLPSGEYTIELIDGQGVRYQRITYSISSGINLAKLRMLGSEENKYLLTIPNRGKNALTIRIFDAADHVKYESTEVAKGDFGKVYDLSAVKGPVTFEITDANGKFKQLTAH